MATTAESFNACLNQIQLTVASISVNAKAYAIKNWLRGSWLFAKCLISGADDDIDGRCDQRRPWWREREPAKRRAPGSSDAADWGLMEEGPFPSTPARRGSYATVTRLTVLITSTSPRKPTTDIDTISARWKEEGAADASDSN